MNNQSTDWSAGALIVIVIVAVMLLVGSWDSEIDAAYRDSRNCEFRGACGVKP